MKLNYALLPTDTTLRCWRVGSGGKINLYRIVYAGQLYIYLICQRRRRSLTIARGPRSPFSNRCRSCVLNLVWRETLVSNHSVLCLLALDTCHRRRQSLTAGFYLRTLVSLSY